MQTMHSKRALFDGAEESTCFYPGETELWNCIFVSSLVFLEGWFVCIRSVVRIGRRKAGREHHDVMGNCFQTQTWILSQPDMQAVPGKWWGRGGPSSVMGIVGTRTDASRVGQAVVQKALGSHTWIESPRSSIDREFQELVDRLAKIVEEE